MSEQEEKKTSWGFGKTLKNLVFEEEVVSPQKNAPTPSPVVSVVEATQGQQVPRSEPIENSSAYKALLESVFSKDTGFSRLLKSIKPLEGIIPDESQRLRAALAILNGNGLSTGEIIKTLAVHDSILSAEKRRFEEDLNTQLTAKVGTLDSECTALETEIKQKSEAVARIQREISEAENKKASLISRSAAERERINTIAQEFGAAHLALANFLEEYGKKLGVVKS